MNVVADPKTISPYEGVIIIYSWCQLLLHFMQAIKKPAAVKQVFHAIFKEDAEHLLSKFKRLTLGSFFLNLDNKNQVAFLIFVDTSKTDLSFPDIPDWKAIGQKHGMHKWENYEFTQEDVRTIVVGFKHLSEWDCYPPKLVWLRKFALCAENNSINNENYNGDKFGNLINWIDYYRWLNARDKIELCKLLVEYN